MQIHQKNGSSDTIQKYPKTIAALEKEKDVKVEENNEKTVDKTIFQNNESLKSIIESHLQCVICYELFLKVFI